MKPYLTCLDLDGALLNDNREVSDYIEKVLTSLQKQGHYLTIATGRPHRASQIYYHEPNMNTLIANLNGTYVHHPEVDDFEAKHETLDVDIARSIIEALQKANVTNTITEVRDSVSISSHDPRLFEGFSTDNSKIQTGNLLEKPDESPTSILVEAEEVSITRIKQMLTHFYAKNIEHRHWGIPFPVIEIIKRGVSKARGIDYVKSYLNIDSSSIITLGDEDNDLEMIEYAQYGIATDSDLDDLKHIASYITYSNNEDGIGCYLNEFFKLEVPY